MATVTIGLHVKPYYEGTKTLDGNTYKLRVWWNTTTEIWYMSITGLNNYITILGIPLLPGMDLLSPHGYSEILGQLWLVDGKGLNENPDYYGIGGRWILEYTPVGE